MTTRSILIITVVSLLFFSCKNSWKSDIKEGEIHFDISYNNDVTGFQREVMPKHLIVSFKNDRFFFDITSFIGNSGIMFLSNPEKNIYDIYCGILSSRYYYAAKKNELMPGFSSMQGMILNKTSKTKYICGYLCNCMEAIFPSDKNRIFEIWYTKDIDIKNPNNGTPFHSIDGVVMSFFFIMGETEIFFVANNVYRKNIDDKIFDRRKNYIPVNREYIDQMIVKMTNMP